MTDTNLILDADLAGLTGDAWLDALEDVAEEHGYFEPLGPDHQAVFLAAGPRLLVTFEDAETICKTAHGEPRSFAFARDHGWSILSVISNGESWFRHPAIYQFFDKLTDEGTFDGFDDVLFFGASGAGYAAAAYSVAAPGARVLALRPQSTLSASVAGWDTRHVAHRRHDFTKRYGFAPDMIEAAQTAYIVYSPLQKADAIHAAMFTRDNVMPLRVPGIGGRIEAALDSLDVLDDLIMAAMKGDISPASFRRLLAAPLKSYGHYLRTLHKRAMDNGHPQLAANLAAAVLRQGPDAFFEAKLAEHVGQGITPRRALSASAAE